MSTSTWASDRRPPHDPSARCSATRWRGQLGVPVVGAEVLEPAGQADPLQAVQPVAAPPRPLSRRGGTARRWRCRPGPGGPGRRRRRGWARAGRPWSPAGRPSPGSRGPPAARRRRRRSWSGVAPGPSYPHVPSGRRTRPSAARRPSSRGRHVQPRLGPRPHAQQAVLRVGVVPDVQRSPGPPASGTCTPPAGWPARASGRRPPARPGPAAGRTRPGPPPAGCGGTCSTAGTP